MLNPYLEKRLYSLPVQPVLVEIDPNQLAATLGQITGLNLPIVSQLPAFGFAAIPPVSPSVIKKINSLPGVRMVHATRSRPSSSYPHRLTSGLLPLKAERCWVPRMPSERATTAKR